MKYPQLLLFLGTDNVNSFKLYQQCLKGLTPTKAISPDSVAMMRIVVVVKNILRHTSIFFISLISSSSFFFKMASDQVFLCLRGLCTMINVLAYNYRFA